MKIIYFITSIDRACGGTSAYIGLLAPQLDRSADIYVVTGESPDPIEIANTDTRFIPMCCRTVRSMRRTLDEIRPDIVHIHGIWQPQTWLMQREARRRGIKVVITPHGMLEPWIMSYNRWKKSLAMTLYQRKALMSADCLHATAKSEADNIVSLGIHNDIAVIENGVDVKNIIIKEHWDKTKTILFLSRIHPKKGIDILIEAAASIREALEGYRIIIAGEGETQYTDYLKELAASLGVSDIFDFVGGVYGPEKWELIRKADFFVLPTHSENFGIAIAEAMASGTPVITTKGTPWEDIEARGCGWWIDLGTNTLAQSIRQACGMTEAELEKMGRAGRTLIDDKYSVEAVAGKMMELYDWILEREAKPAFIREYKHEL